MKDIWKEKMNNLLERRKTAGHNKSGSNVSDYASHLSKVSIGMSVLDVGCGDMAIKKHIGEKLYVGIDAFPVNSFVVGMEIEQCAFPDKSFDTTFCFAVLDGLYDPPKALQHMARVTKKNIVFLTGIGIEPDQYHTYMITEQMLSDNLPGFKVGYKEWLQEKVLLIEYICE